jgi:sugar/nucleoside kinase (ribokinase family)
MGDLNVELTTTLDASFASLDRDCLTYRAVKTCVGGTAANLALAAKNFFGSVNVIGRVGADPFGELIVNGFAEQNVHFLCSPLDDKSTGLALYVRDATTANAMGVRLLVIDRGANPFIDVDEIEKHIEAIQTSDVFFVDGYCFLQQPRRQAAERAVQMAHDARVLVAFDLVPHDAHRFFSFDEVRPWLDQVDVIITEVRTIRRLMGLVSEDEVHDPELVRDTLELLKAEFYQKYIQLRFGVGNIEETLHSRPGRMPELRVNHYIDTPEPRGFGDRLSASEIAEYLADR